MPYFLLLALYCAFIFWLSNQPVPPKPVPIINIPGVDKIAHAILFGGLTACLSVGIRRSNEDPPLWVQWHVPVGFAILYGISDEIHQSFIAERSADAWDVVADGVGAILAQRVLFRFWSRKPELDG